MQERFRDIFSRETKVAVDGDITHTVEISPFGQACRKGAQLGKKASIGAIRFGKEATIGAIRLGKKATVRAVRDLGEAKRNVAWGEIAGNYTVQNFLGLTLVCLIAKERGYFDTPEAQRVFSWVRSLLPSSETKITQERTGVPTLFHEVFPGDTLTEIAQRYGVTPEMIGQANGIEDLNSIGTGQILAIPLPEWVYKPFEVEPPPDIKYYLPWEYNSNPPVIEGLAHFYGAGEPLNKNTASGEIFNPYAPDKAASWLHEMGKRVRVTNLYTGMSVDVEINDRGPNRLYKYENGIRKNVIIDLTHSAFRQIEPVAGEILVKVELLPDK